MNHTDPVPRSPRQDRPTTYRTTTKDGYGWVLKEDADAVRAELHRMRVQRDQYRQALERIADDRQTSMRWRSSTSGGAIEKPNVRAVAMDALGLPPISDEGGDDA